MQLRTDLAIELQENKKVTQGVSYEKQKRGKAVITKIQIKEQTAALELGKPIGTYITIELPLFSDYVDDENIFAPLIAEELIPILPKSGMILVAGLGNRDITPDAIGPLAAEKILATRHLKGEFARVCGLDSLRSVAVIEPGVLGKTGIETADILKGMIHTIQPSCLIVIDALAASMLSHLGNTIQICDTGISPGSGVGNCRPNLSQKTLGIPVIAIGVPTVVDGETFVASICECEKIKIGDKKSKREVSGAGMLVTPREVDLMIERASQMVAQAVNGALQPMLTPEELLMLMQ